MINLKLTIGLVNDGIKNTERINLYKYTDIYFPDNDYYNCNLLPPEWIELFEEEEFFSPEK